jgi:serine/threonine protein kinase
MLRSEPLSYSMREPNAPLRFGRYEVLFRIAAGGMAEVYAARMVGEGGFEKPVALKRMLPTLAEDERFVQMFLDEGRLAAHISSPHVVQTLDLGRAEDDSLYLVMELVVGVSLSALIRAVLKKRTPFPVPVAVDLLSQAAMGLHDAHEARTMYGQPLQIVHRDVSPQNILVDVSGRVRITDFGVARALERATHTQSGEVKGKIGYFAPEQVRGKDVDRRTDVYALGIVAWEVLAGRRLFAGENPAQTLDMVMSMPIPRLDTLRPDVPPALAEAIAHALERDLSHRTPSAGDFAEELRYSLRPAGSAAVAALVREHGGESLMKLEDGLRAQSPSALSRVRRSSADAAPGPTSRAEQAQPMQGPPMQGQPMQGQPMQGPPMQGPPMQGPPMQGPPMQPMHGMQGPAQGQAFEPITIATSPSEILGVPAPTTSGGQAIPSASMQLEPAPSSNLKYVLGAIAAIGVLGAVGLGVAFALGGGEAPEPRAVPLPPVPVVAVPIPLPAAPLPAPAGTPAPPTLPSGEQPSEVAPTTPSTATQTGTGPSSPTPTGVAGRRPAPHAQAHGTAPTIASSTRGDEPPEETVATTTMSTAPTTAPTMSTEPAEGTTTRMTTGMGTGLVGVSDFERELGIQ